MMSKILLLVAISSFVYFARCDSKEETDKLDNEENNTESSNDTVPQDLYVIKTVVYEVGILTDATNDTDDSPETHEQVDVSFFDPSSNGSTIDLSHIPVPIQTNVSGVTVTGILPGSDLYSILSPPAENGSVVPILPTKQVTVTQNISTTNPEEGSEIISNLPKLLGLTKNESQVKEETTSSEKKDKE